MYPCDLLVSNDIGQKITEQSKQIAVGSVGSIIHCVSSIILSVFQFTSKGVTCSFLQFMFHFRPKINIFRLEEVSSNSIIELDSLMGCAI
jgi:hypothetical protein